MPKRVNITESQWGIFESKLLKAENDWLQMDLVDIKQKSRELIGKAFKLGIKYAMARYDLYTRKNIKNEFDGLVQTLDKDELYKNV